MERLKKTYNGPLIIRKCHKCGHINESHQESQECSHCHEAFLPLKYMSKIHQQRDLDRDIYEMGHEVDQNSIIHGLYVIW